MFQALFQGLNATCFTPTFLEKNLLGAVGRPSAAPNQALSKKEGSAWRVAVLMLRSEERQASFGKKINKAAQQKTKALVLTKEKVAKKEEIQAKLNQATSYAANSDQFKTLVDSSTRALITLGSSDSIFAIHLDLKNEFGSLFSNVDLGGVFTVKDPTTQATWIIDLSLPEVIIGWRTLRDLKNTYLFKRHITEAGTTWKRAKASFYADADILNHAQGTVLSHMLMILEVPLWLKRTHLATWLRNHEAVVQKVFAVLKLLAVRETNGKFSVARTSLKWLQDRSKFVDHLLDNHTKHFSDARNLRVHAHAVTFAKSDGTYGAGIIYNSSDTTLADVESAKQSKFYYSALIKSQADVALPAMTANLRSRQAAQFLTDFFRGTVPETLHDESNSLVPVIPPDPILNNFTFTETSGPTAEEVEEVALAPRALPTPPQRLMLPVRHHKKNNKKNKKK